MSSPWSLFLECGAWVLGSWRSPSSSFHSRDGWYFFPIKSKKGRPIGRCHWQCKKKKKMKVWRWVSKNGFVAKMVKNTKIWKDFEGDERKQVRGPGKWFSREEMVWRGRKCKWMKCVNSNNGEREKSAGKKKKMKTKKEGGSKIPPPLFYLSCWVNSGLTEFSQSTLKKKIWENSLFCSLFLFIFFFKKEEKRNKLFKDFQRQDDINFKSNSILKPDENKFSKMIKEKGYHFSKRKFQISKKKNLFRKNYKNKQGFLSKRGNSNK